MAFTAAQRKELDAYKAELREEMRAENNAQNAAPVIPNVPELELPDVLRILVQHSRIPLESTQLQCLAAIDKAFQPDEPVDADDDVDTTAEDKNLS